MNPIGTQQQEIDQLQQFFDNNQEIGIVIGEHQNLDTYAAALALFLTLSQRGTKVQIVSKKEPTVEVSNLVGVNRILKNFQGSTTKLVVELPYIKGEVEKVLFTEAPNTINFHLTAAEGRNITPFDTKDVRLNWEGGNPQAIIAVGVGNENELVEVVDISNVQIVNIDNFSGNTRFGNISIVNESFSSLSEIVAKIIKDLNLPYDVDIAQNILDGVLFATRNFSKPNTSPLAFEAVSNAMYQGAQRKNEEQPQQRQQGFSQRQNQTQGRRDQSFPVQNRQNQGQGRQQGFSQRQNQPRQQQRVSRNDFPAQHMQGQKVQPRQNENRQENRFDNTQNFSNQNNQEIRNIRDQISGSQSMPSNDNFQNFDNSNQNVPQNIEPDNQNQNSQQPQNQDVPDDWLMPKVFKSSKNNN